MYRVPLLIAYFHSVIEGREDYHDLRIIEIS
jgi:hypothetical protein